MLLNRFDWWFFNVDGCLVILSHLLHAVGRSVSCSSGNGIVRHNLLSICQSISYSSRTFVQIYPIFLCQQHLLFGENCYLRMIKVKFPLVHLSKNILYLLLWLQNTTSLSQSAIDVHVFNSRPLMYKKCMFLPVNIWSRHTGQPNVSIDVEMLGFDTA